MHKTPTMHEKDFIPSQEMPHLPAGKVTAEAPSNIALVKYWGKYGLQLPTNASISFTLSQCKTVTELEFTPKEDDGNFDFQILFDGQKKESFQPKIHAFFERILDYAPFLTRYKFSINTTNTFPHSSGIASSASGMAALALCLMEMEKQACPDLSATFGLQKASFLARLGSGSACRSVYGGLVVWGEHAEVKASSNLYGVPYPAEIHAVFKTYQDVILLVDEGEKQVSSTVGHNLMNDHPFATQRFAQAQENLTKLTGILKTGNVKAFQQLVETEALSLHAMMMTAQPSFILMKPNTLAIIHKIWAFRKETDAALCFTLDAGANVHLLFPEEEKENVLTFIEKELAGFCQNGKYIADFVCQ